MTKKIPFYQWQSYKVLEAITARLQELPQDSPKRKQLENTAKAIRKDLRLSC